MKILVLLLTTFLLLICLLPGIAQDLDEINDFLKRGKECYDKKDFLGAIVEYENVLLLDSTNLDAKITLGQIYLDQKNTLKAKQILLQAQTQAPNNSKIKQLLKLIGSATSKPSKKEGDPVVYEALTLLGSDTRLRPYGLVIPEPRVITAIATPTMEKTDDVQIEGDQPPVELKDFQTEEGPLSQVFEMVSTNGLPAGLDKYFELVLADKSLAAVDDKGLIKNGMAFFKPRLEVNAKDDEARYYVGMMLYINGALDQTASTLEPLRKSDNSYKEKLTKVFAEIDAKKAEEEAAKLAAKREQEAREAALLAQQAQAQAAANAAAANGVASGTEAIHAEGYELYKKGQLDVAIEKFQAAIKEKSSEPKYFYHLGLALTDKGLAGNIECFDRAIESFNQVIQLDPGGKMAKDSEVMIRDIVAAKNSLKK